MRTKKWLSLMMAAMTALCVWSCKDWGEMDPPAGNDVYPKLESIASYTFNQVLDPTVIQTFAYSGGDTPEIIVDEERDSVLHLTEGYARINNPLTSVKVQNGVSLTFWMKQPVQTDEETEEAKAQDTEGAIFSFQNTNGTQKLFFTANGWLSYDGVDGEYEDNNPSEYKTGFITPGEWHYVAICVNNEGYALYVDGQRKVNKNITNEFDASKMVQFMASAAYLYIGYGAEAQTTELLIDDLTLYRNCLTNTQIKVPSTSGEEDDKNYIIVGNEDCSTGWWSAFSDLVTVEGDQTIHFGFYNHNTGSGNNYENWLVVLTNGKNREESGYAEYFVLRADAFGWGDSNYNGDNITHNFNFDDGSYVPNMNGAYVDLTLTRKGNRIDMEAIVTTTSGITYTYTFYYEGTLADTIGAFLTCEKSYLEIDPDDVYAGESYSTGEYRVGPADLSAGWWSYFSNYTTLSGDTTSPFVYTFYNYTTGANNWNNWLIVATNGKERDADGYAEYFVLRSDAYGWGDSNYSGDNISASYDWETYTTQMNGAYCRIIIIRKGNRVDMTAQTTAADGTQLNDYTFHYDNITTTDLTLFLTVDGASLDMRTVAHYPFLTLE